MKKVLSKLKKFPWKNLLPFVLAIVLVFTVYHMVKAFAIVTYERDFFKNAFFEKATVNIISWEPSIRE